MEALTKAQIKYDNLLPVEPEEDEEDVIDNWASGIYAGPEIYDEPLSRLTEGEELFHLVAAESDEEILGSAKAVRSALIQYIMEASK